MNKTDLAEAVAKQRQISKSKALEVLDVVLRSLTEALQRGEKAQIKGFGSFLLRERKARSGRNPQTGEMIDLPASRSVTFKAATALLAGDSTAPTLATATLEEHPVPGVPAAQDPAEQDPPAPAVAVDPGRRQHPRAPIEIEVNYPIFDTFISDYARNISRGGLFIRTATPLPRGTELTFQLKIQDREAPLALKGAVAWVRETTDLSDSGQNSGMGIRFVYDTPEQQWEVEAAIEALLEEGPLPAPSALASGDGRSVRYAVELKVEYKDVDQLCTEYTRNISRGGLFIHSASPLPPGTEIIFQLTIPLLHKPLPLKGRVAWCRDPKQSGEAGRPGMGIQFVYDSEEERLRLERIIRALAKEGQD